MVTYPSLHPSEASFVNIRSRNSLYVDKTHHFRNLLETEGEDLLIQPDLAVRHQLLLRPRRFGKTLLINTLEAWFQGLPPDTNPRGSSHDTTLPDCPDGWSFPSWLWDGLDAADWHGVHGWHPVVRLDMSRRTPNNPDDMEGSLQSQMMRLVNLWKRRGVSQDAFWNTPHPNQQPGDILTDLLDALGDQYGAEPVVLVDEYDAPINHYLGRGVDPTSALDALRELYRVLKDDAGLLYGVFVTGITRIARQHLFSAANNFVDISADEPYATLCGFTEKEVDACLAPHRDALRDLEPAFDDDRILADWRDMYNGYRFARHPDTELVYNPFTLTNGLHDTLTNETGRWLALQGEWPSAWSATGHPGLAVRLAVDTRQALPSGVRAGLAHPNPEGSLDNLQRPDFARLMQDTGYYTWHGGDDGHEPYLDFPNREVSESWWNDILNLWDEHERTHMEALEEDIRGSLAAGDLDEFKRLLKIFFSKFAHQNLDSESCFRALLQSVGMRASNDTQAEKSTQGGRSDLEVGVGNHVYVMEIKYCRPSESNADKVKEALEQIRSRTYGYEHLHGDRAAHAVAISFRKDDAEGVQMECLYQDLHTLLGERNSNTAAPSESRRNRFAGIL